VLRGPDDGLLADDAWDPDARMRLLPWDRPRRKKRRWRMPANSCGFTGLAHPVWSTPAGYYSPGNRRAFVDSSIGRSTSPRARPNLEGQLKEMMIIAGTPKQVIAKLRILLEQTRPGIIAFWGNDGTVSHEHAKTCIRLLGQEVFPAVREMAKEFDLKGLFEINQPVSVRYINGGPRPQRVAAE